MNKFKIGDKVKVVADEERLDTIDINIPMTGEIGIVNDFLCDTPLPYAVTVDNGYDGITRWFNKQDLELVEPQQEPQQEPQNTGFRIRETDDCFNKWTVADGSDYKTSDNYVNNDGTVGLCESYLTKAEAQAAFDLYLEKQQEPERTFIGHPDEGLEVVSGTPVLLPVSHKDYMSLSDAYDEHSKNLMGLKGEEYAIDGDFLAMENRLAGMLGDTPEYVSLVMAGKHITALGIILLKNDVDKIKLAKLDERIRDATNLLKITAVFIHAKQKDFSLHLGKDEKTDRTTPTPGGY